ncbi:hypothetical protein [Pelagibius sp.]|nr:hypothetical protein [Pelagibius sp.]
MTINSVVKAAVPVVIGVFLAGLLMNALRDNDFVKNAIDGFDG